MSEINSILKPFVGSLSLREVSPHIFSSLSEEDSKAEYDKIARFYDVVVGSVPYNLLIWKTHPSAYLDFARRELAGAKNILDVGSGTLSFTADFYLDSPYVPIVVVDRSVKMLEIARERLMKKNGGVFPDHIFLMQGDLFALPFKKHSFDVVAAFGIYHIFTEKKKLMNALQEQLSKRGGKLVMNALIKGGFPGDFVLRAMKHRGMLATVESGGQVRTTLDVDSSLEWIFREKGNWIEMSGK